MKTIAILGFGTMGSAIAERIKDKYRVCVFDKDKNKTQNLKGIETASSVLDLVNQAETLILAVKPQDFDAVLKEIKNYIKEKLIISIAAGITCAYIQNRLGSVRIIRAMPNLPARIGRGMVCVSKASSAREEDLDFSLELFGCLGEAMVIDESMMDAATAVSGSGPGFLYDSAEGKDLKEIKQFIKDYFIPQLAASAEGLGFSKQQANVLAEVTAGGSLFFLEESGLPAQKLKEQVASKGGTTEAGLAVLHRGGTLIEAVKAAKMKAEELSRRE